MSQETYLVVVWASWSPRSNDVPNILKDLAEHWSLRAQTIGVLFQEDQNDLPQTFEAQIGVPIYRDGAGRFSKKWDVSTLPFLLIFQNGKRVFGGRLPTQPNSLIRRALRP